MGAGAVCAESREQLDFGEYLDCLEEHGHNFIRLWRWEQFQSQARAVTFTSACGHSRGRAPVPDTAKDGQPKFDLERFDEAFFDRLRERVVAAGERGTYVAVMFFEGWAPAPQSSPDHVEGHPFHAANNVNGVAIGSIVDYQVLPLDRRARAARNVHPEGRRHPP
jgi:hypothetical protein